MVLRYPPAKQKFIQINFYARVRSVTRAVIWHTTASLASSQFGWFSNPKARASSNIHIDMAGGVEQYVDLRKGSWTSGAACSSTIGVETAGKGVEPWTKPQLESIIRFQVWCHHVFDVVNRLMESSAANESGIGWHRLGIRGNFPQLPSILAGLIQRGKGEEWASSSSFGKVCPGDKRIEQMPYILKEVTKRTLETPDNLLVRYAKRDLVVKDKPWGKKIRTVKKGTEFLVWRGSRAKWGRFTYVKSINNGWVRAGHISATKVLE